MKKGIALPIEFIIILALAVVTLAAIMLFFSYSQRSGGGGISMGYATASCRNECVKTQERLSTRVEYYEGKIGICKNIADFVNSDFCLTPQFIEGSSIPCYNITTCRLRDSEGKECTMTIDTCTSPP